MRILIDATPLQTGHRRRGVGAYTRELLRGIFQLDRQNSYRLIVHPESGRRFSEPLLNDLPPNVSLARLARLSLGRLTAFVSHQLFLPPLLAREQADLFHAPGFVAAFSVPGIPWRCPLPLVVTIHDFIPLHIPALFNDKAINRWWYARQMRLAGQAQHLICVSSATRQDALRFLRVPPDRCSVVLEGVDPAVFHSPAPGHPPSDPPFILFIGGDYPNKNRAAALAAFAQFCRQSNLPHHLLLVGPDPTPDAELRRRHPGLDLNRLRRIDSLNLPDLARLYRRADLLLFPSTCEGFGLPVLEAMASGTPVITSNVSSLPEVAGGAALLVDPHDPAAIAEALQRVLSDPTLHASLRSAGLARAQTLTWTRMAEETISAYGRA